MSTIIKPSDARQGDKVRVSIEGTVLRASIFGEGLTLSVGSDQWQLDLSDTPDTQVELLSRPKPKDGDILTANDVRATRWKRGTIIKNVTTGHQYALQGNGRWRDLTDCDWQFNFEALGHMYRVVHVG